MTETQAVENVQPRNSQEYLHWLIGMLMCQPNEEFAIPREMGEKCMKEINEVIVKFDILEDGSFHMKLLRNVDMEALQKLSDGMGS